MGKLIQFIIKGAADHIFTVKTGAGKAGKPLIISAQSGADYELREVAGNVAPQQILVKRKGKDLLIKIDPQSETNEATAPADIIIKDYYAQSMGKLIGLAENGQYYNLVPQEGNSNLIVSNLENGDLSYQSLGYSGVGSENDWYPYVLGALVLGGLAAAAGGGGGGDDDGDTIVLTPPTTTISIDSITEDTGTAGDFITNDNDGLTIAATLTAALAADEKLMYSNDNGATWSDITSSVTGTSVSYNDLTLTSTATVQMKVVDEAGNSGAVESRLITIDTTAPISAASVVIVLDSNNDGTVDSSEQGSATATDIMIGIPSNAQIGDVITVTNELTGTIIATYTVGTNANAGETKTITGIVLPSGSDALTVSTSIQDAAGNYGPTASDSVIVNQAPIAYAQNTTLLSLIGLEALGLLDISQQAVAAIDFNNNIQEVEVTYSTLLNISTYQLAASSAMAEELGLHLTIENNPGFLGLVASSSTITITAADGGTIDNIKLNELLSTIHFEDTLLDVGVGDILSITATDTDGVADTDISGDLLNIGLLATQYDDSRIQEGNVGDDIMAGTANSDRLYGYEGDDNLAGLGGNDLLRGGDGNDTLSGGDGADLLIGGNGIDAISGGNGNDVIFFDAEDTIDGGADIDILFIDGKNISLDLTAISDTQISNIETINITGNGDNTLTLNYSDLLALNDSDTLYVTGNGGDTVNLSGETFIGSETVGGVVYNTYNLGGTEAADIWIQQDITVL